MPDALLHTTLTTVQRRWRMRSLLFAIAAGGAVFAPSMLIAVFMFDTSRVAALWLGLMAAVGAAAWLLFSQRGLTSVDAARAIEASAGSLDNLIVTAAELEARPRPVRTEIRDEIVRQAAERLRPVDPSRVVTLAQPAGVAIVVLIGCAVLSSRGVESITQARMSESSGVPVGEEASSFAVTVTPPAYTRRPVQTLTAPPQVSVIAGSRVQVDAIGGARLKDWIATESAGIEVRPSARAAVQFLSVIVVPDAPPAIRVITPGKDSAFATPSGQIAIAVQGLDDLGLASLALRFTKASGGGENLTFTEGDVPLTIERVNERQWTGRATLVLDTLKLEDGDMVVYRAIGRDTNPQGTVVQSDQYLIEIGKNAEIADAGFSLPAEEKKYAISQQMVIYKTEQLLTRKPADFLDQSRGIGMEQRMVRAEVVFLGGGEVEDELEEAARSDELTEGRLQNTGRAEMMTAINAMSRAEAQLNDGRAKEALVFERQALAALERALDRRRYFLRTLPDRSRIDITRRLTGERKDARSWTRDANAGGSRAFDADRRMMRELAAASTNPASINASLAARVSALDAASADIQKAAVAIAGATTDTARQDAIRIAMEAVTAHALKTLASSTPVDLRDDPLSGRLADQLRARPRR